MEYPKKLSRTDAFNLLQETYIRQYTFMNSHKLEREVAPNIKKIQQCKSLEDLIRLIYDLRDGVDLLCLYAKALIEPKAKDPQIELSLHRLKMLTEEEQAAFAESIGLPELIKNSAIDEEMFKNIESHIGSFNWTEAYASAMRKLWA